MMPWKSVNAPLIVIVVASHRTLKYKKAGGIYRSQLHSSTIVEPTGYGSNVVEGLCRVDKGKVRVANVLYTQRSINH